MECSGAPEAPPTYALVSYIPAALGDFLNEMRRMLVPPCTLLSHITFLPPRQLAGPVEQLIERVGEALERIEPFEIRLGDVEKFPGTDVVYLSVRDGRSMVERIHRELSQGVLAFREPFPFHPHVTLAQEIRIGEVEATFTKAKKMWDSWSQERSFPVEQVTFVQNHALSGWGTIAEFPLSRSVVVK